MTSSWSPQLSPLRVDMVEVLYRQEGLLSQKHRETSWTGGLVCDLPNRKWDWLNWDIAASSWCTKIEHIQPTPFVVWCLSAPVLPATWWHGIKSERRLRLHGFHMCVWNSFKETVTVMLLPFKGVITDDLFYVLKAFLPQFFIERKMSFHSVLSNQTYNKHHVLLCF